MSRLEAILPAQEDAAGWRNSEWLVTNGLGGYASGTLAGVCTRRYHGMFVPNLSQPRGRHVLVSRLDEHIQVEGWTWRLGGCDRLGQPLAEANAPWLRAFVLDGNMACWIFQCGEVTLERRLVMPHQRNVACLRYVIKSGPAATVRLRPFLALRRQDAPLRRPGYGRFSLQPSPQGGWQAACDGRAPTLRMQLLPGDAPFVADACEDADGWLWREELRGYESHEANASPGYFEWNAAPGEAALLVLSADDGYVPPAHADEPFDVERQRNRTLVSLAGAQADPFLARLAVAADQFLILPENRLEESAQAVLEGHPLRTVVAGYHWFLDWGRDTMIALEGLMLATGRHQEARATLLTFSHYLRDGLLPNLFPEGSREGWYHTVDATLWYFHAIHRYLQATGDARLLDELLPALKTIMQHHFAGTRFGIGVDPSDGLLRAGSSQQALTWMDAHMGEWIVTPRRGKPVEIQALWYNALCLMRDWSGSAPERDHYEQQADLARSSFNAQFWNPVRDCLFDVIDGEVGEEGCDARLRPNQLFAISLDHPVLDRGRWHSVLETVRTHLLTSVGLRTLEQADPEYSPSYHGNLHSRDAAYHQGTVWPWLLGAYVDAWLRAHGDGVGARGLLQAFEAHLQVAGIGTISEVFDGNSPHTPHGCIAQAWSVAEVLRCWKRTTPASG
jgi:predicted glycogen debranching enzyme